MRYIKYSKNIKYLCEILTRLMHTRNADNPRAFLVSGSVDMIARDSGDVIFKLVAESEFKLPLMIADADQILNYEVYEEADWSCLGSAVEEYTGNRKESNVYHPQRRRRAIQQMETRREI